MSSIGNNRRSQKSERTADLVILRVHPISFEHVALLRGKRVRVALWTRQDDDGLVAVTPHKLQLSHAHVADVLEKLRFVVVELPEGATRSRRWPTAGRTDGLMEGRAHARLAWHYLHDAVHVLALARLLLFGLPHLLLLPAHCSSSLSMSRRQPRGTQPPSLYQLGVVLLPVHDLFVRHARLLLGRADFERWHAPLARRLAAALAKAPQPGHAPVGLDARAEFVTDSQ